MSAGEVIESPEVGISDHSDLSRFEPSCTMSAHRYDGATAFGVSAVAVPPTPLWTAPSETVISNKSFLLHVASVRYLATMTRKVDNADPDMALFQPVVMGPGCVIQRVVCSPPSSVRFCPQSTVI